MVAPFQSRDCHALRDVVFALCTLAAIVIAGCDRQNDVTGKPTGHQQPADGANHQPVWFEEIAGEAGLIFKHVSGHDGEAFYLPEITGGGVAVFDMNNSGALDVYFVQSGRITDDPADRPGNQLFRNRGDGTFEEITDGSGTDDRGYGMGVAVGDYNRSGFLDLYVTNVGPNVLLRNNGDETFTDVTDSADVVEPGWSTGAAFFDANNDGELDLFVVNYLYWSVETERECYVAAGRRDYCAPAGYNAPARDALYRNNGDGTFENVSSAAGLHEAFGNGLGVACADFDLDGWMDVFVANDGTPNQLWMNQGDGSFVDRAFVAGCAIDQDGRAKAGMGVALVDFDHDGYEDILVVNLTGETDSFYRNRGTYFVDDTARVGLRGVSRGFTRWGVAFFDFNNDGQRELYQTNGRVQLQSFNWTNDPYAEPNLLHRLDDQGRYREADPRGGTAELLVHSSRATAFGDLNNNGQIDVVVVNRDAPAYLLRNVAGDGGNWVMFRVLDDHGRDALHARLRLDVGGRTIYRTVRTAYSYLAANDPRVHVGLGESEMVRNVTVLWPGGVEETFGEAAANQILTLRRGEGEAEDFHRSETAGSVE